jgi:hypothetical protein
MEDSAIFAVPSVTGSTSLAAESYKRAQRLYVTKKFHESYDTLEPLLKNGRRLRDSEQLTEHTWINCWKLYFLLIDSAARGGVEADWPKKKRQDLAARATSESLWDEVTSAYNGLDHTPLQVSRALFLLATKYVENVDKLAEKMESLVSSLSDGVYQFDPDQMSNYIELLDTYVLRILPKKGDFDLAREFVDANVHYDLGKKTTLRAKLEAYEKERANRKARDAEEIERQKKLESERVAQAQSQAQGQALPSPSPGSPPQAQSQSPPGPSAANDSRGSPRSKSPTIYNKPRIQGFSGLVSYWTQWAKDFTRGRSLLQVLLVICIIVLSLANPRIKERIKNLVGPLYSKIIDTARMAFKVSYV